MTKAHRAYVAWVLAQGWADPSRQPTPLEQRQWDGGDIIVLHRDGRLQVECARFTQPCQIARHRHPGMNTCEYLVAGSGVLMVNRRVHRLSPLTRPEVLPIPRWAWHGGYMESDTAAFLSIQEWVADVPPTSALENWEGPNEKVSRLAMLEMV